MLRFVRSGVLLLILLMGLSPQDSWSATSAEDIAPWPSREIPYLVDASLTGELVKTIQRAIDRINSLNVVHLLEGSGPKHALSSKILFVYSSHQCSSGYGWRDGPNTMIRIYPGCSYGTVLHEILHALGMVHEQVNPLRSFQFFPGRLQGLREDQYFNESPVALTPHDPQSIMHYHSLDNSICDALGDPKWTDQNFSKELPHASCRSKKWKDLRADNNGGIDCHKECAVFYDAHTDLFGGQREDLSELDIQGLRVLYP